MKRRTFLKAAGAFLAAPLAFVGAKKTGDVFFSTRPDYLTDNDAWFLNEPFDTKDVKFTHRYSVDWTDWRCFYGSNA